MIQLLLYIGYYGGPQITVNEYLTATPTVRTAVTLALTTGAGILLLV